MGRRCIGCGSGMEKVAWIASNILDGNYMTWKCKVCGFHWKDARPNGYGMAYIKKGSGFKSVVVPDGLLLVVGWEAV